MDELFDNIDGKKPIFKFKFTWTEVVTNTRKLELYGDPDYIDDIILSCSDHKNIASILKLTKEELKALNNSDLEFTVDCLKEPAKIWSTNPKDLKGLYQISLTYPGKEQSVHVCIESEEEGYAHDLVNAMTNRELIEAGIPKGIVEDGDYDYEFLGRVGAPRPQPTAKVVPCPIEKKSKKSKKK
jgi:hypothetical protein